MITELSKESFTKIRHLMGDVSHYLVLTTLVEGRTPGKVWVNHPEEPTTALVWDRLNMLFYLMGDSTDNELNKELYRLIMDTIFPAVIQLQYRKFFLQFTPHHAWVEQTGVILNRSTPDQQSIYSYTFDPYHFNFTLALEPGLPPGFTIARITNDLLNNMNLVNLEKVAYSIRVCWQSTDRYLQNGGIGYCLLKNDVIASWCSTDYVIGNECELYVETFEDYQRKGLGTRVASACVRDCIAKGLIVHWHCFNYAVGSVKIAEKINFKKTAECPVYIVELQDK